MNLKPKHKCLIRYLFDKCDASGMWKPNWKLASLHIGESVTIEDLHELPQDQYEIINGKIFLPDFINFQYGKLSPASPAHKPIFKAIESNNLSDRVFNRVSDTLQEKDTEKEKEKEAEKETDFGKSENLFDESALLPKMLKIFRQHNTNYPGDEQEDFPSLLSISKFICKQEGLSYQPREPDVQKLILTNWEILSEWIADHKFYKNHTLYQVNKFRQGIVTEFKNEKSNPKAKPGANSKVTGAQLNEALTKFRNQGRPVASDG